MAKNNGWFGFGKQKVEVDTSDLDQKGYRWTEKGEGKMFGGLMKELLRGHGNITYSKVDEDQFIEQGFLKNPTVRSIIGSVQSAAMQLKWKVIDKKSGEEVEHPLLDQLLNSPNPLCNWKQFISNTLMFEMLTGNAFIMMDNEITMGGFNQGKPGALINLPSQNVQINLSGDGRYIKSYDLDYFAFQGDIPAEWIIHVRESNPDFDLDNRNSFLYGQSRLTSCMRALDTNNEIIDTLKGVYENGGPRGILGLKDATMGAIMNEVQLKKIEAQLQRNYKGGINAGKFPIHNLQWDWTKIGADIGDLQVREMLENTSMEICKAYNFPYVLISDGQTSYANQNEAKRAMWDNVIKPRIANIKEALDGQFLDKFGDNLEFSIDYSEVAALKEDELERAKRLSIANWMTINEKRECDGLEPIEGGDELPMPMPNMMGFEDNTTEDDKG